MFLLSILYNSLQTYNFQIKIKWRSQVQEQVTHVFDSQVSNKALFKFSDFKTLAVLAGPFDKCSLYSLWAFERFNLHCVSGYENI